MSYSDEVLADSPTVYLVMDETSGTVAADSSGAGRNATIGSTTSLGEPAVMPNGTSSFGIDATTAVVYVPASGALVSTDFAVEAWITLDSLASLHTIASRDANLPRQWSFYVSDGRLRVYSATSVLIGTQLLTVGTPYHVALRYVSGVAYLYVNGVLDGSVTVTLANASSAIRLNIGASPAGNVHTSVFFPLAGNMSHFAYYTQAINVPSAARFAAHYEAGASAPADVVIPGEAFTSIAAGRDGAPRIPILVSGEVFASAATAREGVAQVEAPTPVLIAGQAFTSIAVALDGGIFDAPTGTDTTNAASGRIREGVGTMTLTPPVAPVPPGLGYGHRVDKAVALPTPTLVDGRPT